MSEVAKPPPGSDPATWYYLEAQRLHALLGLANEKLAAIERDLATAQYTSKMLEDIYRKTFPGVSI